MWRIYAVIAYFTLALAIPIAWMSIATWRKARRPRAVVCPANGFSSTVALDPVYAIRMRALGNPEPLVAGCSRWPERASCGRECLGQIGRAV